MFKSILNAEVFFNTLFVLPPLIGMAISCSNGIDNSSGLDMTNGQVISESEFPAVVRAQAQLGEILGGNTTIPCSGTFVSSSTLITAGHCQSTEAKINGSFIPFSPNAANPITIAAIIDPT